MPHFANKPRREMRVGAILRLGPCTSFRRAFTLPELLIAMTITSLVSIVLGGLILAVQTARDHTEGLGEATAQAQATIERIKLTVADAGVYRLSGQPTVLGLAVVRQVWSSSSFPNVLVVWNGGQNGGMAAAGVQSRLPKVNELTIYAPDAAAPARLLEITLPARTDSIDFTASNFSSTVLSLLGDSGARKLVLCDCLRCSMLATSPTAVVAGNVWFELEEMPSAATLASTTPGTSTWNALTWSQGIVGSDFGLRQANLRIELQLALRTTSSQADVLTMPFFGSASYRYAYQK